MNDVITYIYSLYHDRHNEHFYQTKDSYSFKNYAIAATPGSTLLRFVMILAPVNLFDAVTPVWDKPLCYINLYETNYDVTLLNMFLWRYRWQEGFLLQELGVGRARNMRVILTNHNHIKLRGENVYIIPTENISLILEISYYYGCFSFFL